MKLYDELWSRERVSATNENDAISSSLRWLLDSRQDVRIIFFTGLRQFCIFMTQKKVSYSSAGDDTVVHNGREDKKNVEKEMSHESHKLHDLCRSSVKF